MFSIFSVKNSSDVIKWTERYLRRVVMTLLPKLVSKGINPFLFWTIAISSNLIWNISANRYTAVDIALIHAKKSFEKDLLVHRWNASHVGVYVHVSEKTPSNSCLSSISERDITHYPVGSWPWSTLEPGLVYRLCILLSRNSIPRP